MNRFDRHPRPQPNRSKQRGVVLLFSLIALVVMLIAAVAMIRSFNASLFNAGNIGFKRDMQNQSDRAVATVLPLFASGGTFGTAATRANDAAAQNYSAHILATNPQGIPTALLGTDSTFTLGAPDLAADQATTVRYVVDRLCSITGNETSLSAGSCMLGNNPTPSGKSQTQEMGADSTPLCPTCVSASPQGVVYRLSIMVTGPRNTQSFFQTTFTAPSS